MCPTPDLDAERADRMERITMSLETLAVAIVDDSELTQPQRSYSRAFGKLLSAHTDSGKEYARGRMRDLLGPMCSSKGVVLRPDREERDLVEAIAAYVITSHETS
jgi:hypothetical protein